MSEYPAEFEFDVPLTGGTTIHIRPIRPDDAEREGLFFDRVGPDSSYFRFFLYKARLSPEELRFFTTVDYEDRMAFIALDGEDMVAVGRYDVVSGRASAGEGRVAEVAFLVQDDRQGSGIGRHLFDALSRYGRRKGISEFEAYVLADNRSMLRLLRSIGTSRIRQSEQGVHTVRIPLEGPDAAEDDHD